MTRFFSAEGKIFLDLNMCWNVQKWGRNVFLARRRRGGGGWQLLRIPLILWGFGNKGGILKNNHSNSFYSHDLGNVLDKFS